MFGGGPPANYYATTPLEASVLDGTRGIYHGDDKSPSQKFIAGLNVIGTGSFVGPIMLMDYLLYYPFVDCDDLSTQTLTNTVTLPRYESGDGVLVMAVCVSAGVGSGQFTFEYVNSRGETKTSPLIYCSNTAPLLSNIVCTAAISAVSSTPGIFCRLADGDTGVRQINSITFASAQGGLIALVLVKPLVSAVIREAGTANETKYIQQAAPLVRVLDGAFLGICGYFPTGLVANFTLSGAMDFIWDEGT